MLIPVLTSFVVCNLFSMCILRTRLALSLLPFIAASESTRAFATTNIVPSLFRAFSTLYPRKFFMTAIRWWRQSTDFCSHLTFSWDYSDFCSISHPHPHQSTQVWGAFFIKKTFTERKSKNRLRIVTSWIIPCRRSSRFLSTPSAETSPPKLLCFTQSSNFFLLKAQATHESNI